MKKTNGILFFGIFFICSLIFIGNTAHASGDSCMFEVTEDQMPPKIVLFIDNGVSMTHAVWHADFDNDVDFTPIEGVETDVVPNGAAGNGFFNENGYGIFKTAGSYYLVPVGDDLELDTGIRFEETGGKASATWTIGEPPNEKTITLPPEASSSKDENDIIDNAGFFRYSKNYLNWLFFYKAPLDINNDGVNETVYDDTALPDKSRFYYAKQALLTVGKLSSNKALFGIYNFSNDEGSSNVQGLDNVVELPLGATPEENILNSDYINNINNMGTVIYSPLAEGLATIGGDIDSNAFGSLGSTNYCERVFVIVVSTGLSSEDQSDSNSAIPDPLKVDHDQDGTDGYGNNGPGQGTLTVDGTDHTILTRYNGSTYLDDVAHYFFTHDMRVSNDTMNGWQNVMTYTVGFMASAESRMFLINTSNNGNGNPNLTNSSHPEYGKYHFDAQSPNGLSQAILDAVNSILSKPTTFVAPVVPVTRTTSGDKIYMAFFIPSEDNNFWEGYVNKLVRPKCPK
jgi:type IV pilus assembly protein PilY1